VPEAAIRKLAKAGFSDRKIAKKLGDDLDHVREVTGAADNNEG
jgi:hypothetical protein